jgi:hypothetical protein
MTRPDTIRAWLALTEAFSNDEDALARVLHPDFRAIEHPNAISPKRRERGWADVLAGLAMGRKMLVEQRYDITAMHEAADAVTLEAAWTGTMAIDAGPLRRGTVLRAAVCAVFRFAEDGRIVRQTNYDCYDPFAPAP